MGHLRNLDVGCADAGGPKLVLEYQLLGRRGLGLSGNLATVQPTLESRRVVGLPRGKLGRAVNVGGEQLVG